MLQTHCVQSVWRQPNFWDKKNQQPDDELSPVDGTCRSSKRVPSYGDGDNSKITCGSMEATRAIIAIGTEMKMSEDVTEINLLKLFASRMNVFGMYGVCLHSSKRLKSAGHVDILEMAACGPG